MMTKTLLSTGLTVHVETPDFKATLFLLINTTEMLHLMLDYGLDHNSKNLLDMTPLIHIVCYGSSNNLNTSIQLSYLNSN